MVWLLRNFIQLRQKNDFQKHITQKGNGSWKKLSLTAIDNKVMKKNKPGEFTACKRKKGVFDASKFLQFKDNIAKHHCNLHVKKHGRPDCQVEVKAVLPSEKPLPKLPRQ